MNSIIIHKDNIMDLDIFNDDIFFDDYDRADIDEYISTDIIGEIIDKDCDVIYIKDNLSANYLELLGLRVAYHIRVSEKLRYLPIVILSDLDSDTLNKLEPSANILFTKNTYLISNTKEAIESIKQKEFKHLTQEQYQTAFLDNIKVELPKDTSGSHDIANRWSIYRWAEILDAKSEAIDKNKEELENQLYFKYLKAKYAKGNSSNINIKKPTKKGKVLLIDDEYDKGWSDILDTALAKDGLEFDSFEYDFRDKTQFNLYMQIQKKIKDFDPDVVVLDLRLSQSDHEQNDIDSYTGIKVLEKIHEINAGIQVIMLTATSKSTILEKLYDKKILGYIKKEHPEDKNIDTVENINKFVKLIDEGLKRKYLKEVFETMIKIVNILDIDFALSKDKIDCEIFKKFNISKKSYIQFAIKLLNEAQYVFEILDSKIHNRFVYAMLSIVSSFEAINSIFIKENRYDNDIFWDGSTVKNHKLNDKLEELYEKLGADNSLNIENMIRQRNNYLHSNIKTVHIEPQSILELFKAKLKMIEVISNN